MSSKMKNMSEAASVNSNVSTYNEELGGLIGQSWPVGIFWDKKTCPMPVDAQPDNIAINIPKVLSLFLGINVVVKTFSADGKSGMFSECVKQGCQNTGVNFTNVPSGRKDSTDKDILADMFVFALDYRPPACIMLISGDVGFAQALHVLNQRKYTITVVIPTGMDVSSAFCKASKFVLDWPSLACGKDFVPLMISISHHSDIKSLQRPHESSDVEVPNVQLVKPLEHLETKNMSEATSTDSNTRPTGIFWDIENCEVPRDAPCDNIAINILNALRMHAEINGEVKMFSAYGNGNIFPESVKEACQKTGINFINVASGTKDSADKAVLVGIFVFALDNRPPASIMLISGDVDFAQTLHILNQRKYTSILAVPSGVRVSQDLYNTGKFVWDWPSLARGKGPMTPIKLVNSGKGSMPSRKKLQYGTNLLQCSDVPPHKPVKSGKGFLPLRKKSQYVRKSDIQNLKIQLVRLLKLSGGSLIFEQLESKYYDQCKEHLSLAKYGECKLIHLLSKMSDVMTVKGKGTEKFICLHNKEELTFSTNDKKGKEVPDDNIIKCVDAITLDDFSNKQGSYTKLKSRRSWEEGETSKPREEKFYER